MSRRSRTRVLVIDDNVDAADSMALLLGLWGHAAAVCYDATAAVEAARAYRPRVVLLDVRMPGLDGFEVARRLRGRPWFASASIIGISGHSDAACRDRARAAGFDHYLLKPVSLDYLRGLLALATRAPPREGLRAETPPALSASPAG